MKISAAHHFSAVYRHPEKKDGKEKTRGEKTTQATNWKKKQLQQTICIFSTTSAVNSRGIQTEKKAVSSLSGGPAAAAHTITRCMYTAGKEEGGRLEVTASSCRLRPRETHLSYFLFLSFHSTTEASDCNNAATVRLFHQRRRTAQPQRQAAVCHHGEQQQR